MSYELYMPYARVPYGGLGAAPEAQFTPECVAWADANYNFAEYERLRTQELPKLLVKARQLAGVTSNLGIPLSPDMFGRAWSKFDRWGRTARSREDIDGVYGRWLGAVLTWFSDATTLVEQMARSVNLPTTWLVPTNSRSVRIDSSATARISGAEVMTPLQLDSLGYAKRSREGQLPIKRGKDPLRGRPPVIQGAPFSLRLARYRDSVGSADALLKLWKGSQFYPQLKREWVENNAGWLGYPFRPVAHVLGSKIIAPDPVWELVPPAVFVPGTAISAKFDLALGGDDIIAGPREALFFGHEELARIGSRTGQQVVQNAFDTWGAVLVAWADSGKNPLKEEGKQKLRVAGAAIKTAGAAIAGAGTIAANPIVAGIGAVITLVGELFASVIPVTVKCLVPGYKYHKKLGGFCGPAEPLRVRPPSGCSPGTALALDAAREKERERRAWWDAFWAKVKEWAPYAGVAAGGLLAAYVAYRVVRNPAERRRMNSAKSRHRVAVSDVEQVLQNEIAKRRRKGSPGVFSFYLEDADLYGLPKSPSFWAKHLKELAIRLGVQGLYLRSGYTRGWGAKAPGVGRRFSYRPARQKAEISFMWRGIQGDE